MKTYDLDAAADYLKISSDAMRDLAECGAVPGAKIGKRWVFREEDLESYLVEQVRKQTDERRSAFLSGGVAKISTAISGATRSRRTAKPSLPNLPEAA